MKQIILLLLTSLSLNLVYSQEKTKADSLKSEAQQAIERIKDLIDETYSSNNMYKSKSIDDLTKQDLRKFRVEYDKFEKRSYIYPRGKNSYAHYPYIIVTDSGYMSMVLRMRYFGIGWVFAEKLDVIIDDKHYTLEVADSNRNIKSGGYVEEYLYISIDENSINVIKEIGESDDRVPIRFVGKRYKDSSLNAFERTPFLNMYELFNKLKLN